MHQWEIVYLAGVFTPFLIKCALQKLRTPKNTARLPEFITAEEPVIIKTKQVQNDNA